MTTDGFGTAGFNALRRFAAMGAAALFLVSARVEADEAAPLIQTQAERAVILDYETGDVLFEKDARTAAPPASMSKLMTTEMLFQRLKDGSMTLDQELPVSERAWRKQGSKMWVLVNTSVPVEDLLRGIVVQSGNDACIVVAEAIGGTEDAFAEMMNERAAEIGLTDSTFANSTGWPDPNHKMSALDLARLSRHLIAEYPDYYPYFAEREFTWSDITQPNRNPLLFAGVGADGLKTGHTEESGYGLVGSAQVRGDRRIIVIGGLDSEAQRAGEARR
ncbi:MAG: D-alanyl-D-alanine carboxypeptidase family protein, partial [Pseudomonadota bacterium]